jgi:hypothetical protein
MKKLLLVSAVLMLAACGKRDEAPAAGETTTGEMAPAAADTGMGTMAHDSMSMSSDTMMTRDSAK